MTVDRPGRRLFEQVRALRRAKRRMLLRKVTAVPREPGKVLQFPTRVDPPDDISEKESS